MTGRPAFMSEDPQERENVGRWTISDY